MANLIHGFHHRFLEAAPDGPAFTVLALHGTGGDENDLLPLVQRVAPGAAILSPRGKVSERGMPRFFPRLAMGVFDAKDLRKSALELAEFIGEAAETYGFDPSRLLALGFSNGANVAINVLLLRPESLAGAALLRPMLTLDEADLEDGLPDLAGKRVLLASGESDPHVTRDNVEALAALLERGGAAVRQVWQPTGHDLTQEDIGAVQQWFAEQGRGRG